MEDKERVKGKKRRVQHAIPAQKNREMNHIQHLVEDMGTCVCALAGCVWGGGLFEGCFQDRFNVFTEGASEARPG